MRAGHIRGLLVSLFALGAASGCDRGDQSSSLAETTSPACIDAADGIEEKLRCIPGLTFDQVDDATVPGYMRFDMQFSQPEDHNVEGGKTFNQKLVLLHKSDSEPMLLQTSGYAIFSVRLSNVAQQFSMNQIQVEHRYFEASIPESADWHKLDIEQSAADFHAITVAFRQIYAGKWLNTGASKGGMTSVYHRRFYPADLDGTLALVAPLSFSKDDRRYVDFVDHVGGDAYATCRQKLLNLQRTLLSRRSEVLEGQTGAYDQLGSLDVAFEHAVIELPFAFFQYQDARTPANCDSIPGANASTAALQAFQESVNSLSGYSDEGMAGFVPYYFQAANQLGGPGANLDVIGDLLLHKETYNLDQYIPAGLPIDYSNEPMIDVKDWVLGQSEKIMFIYGELDPWTAGAFTERQQGGDSYRYSVARGNHGSNVFLLNEADKTAALAKLASWIGKDAPGETESAQPAIRDSLEDFEAKYLAQRKL